ncbi:MAG TPA: HU family DNA-binding protein [Candidatus Coproplasma stercorigallinarum]|nr:HU family DNA-binding protein [Candidatus Coproplasma stercorigallinarum]
MNKSELVAKIAADADLKKGDAEKFLDAFVATVKEVIAAGDKIQLVGFGTFEAKERGAREGVNPATGEKISIPACKVPSFKPGKGLKEELNK